MMESERSSLILGEGKKQYTDAVKILKKEDNEALKYKISVTMHADAYLCIHWTTRYSAVEYI